MSFITINYASSSAAAPTSYVVPEGMSVSTFLEDVQLVTDFSNITVEVNGVAENLAHELEDGDTISIAQKKTDSGIAVGIHDTYGNVNR